MGVVYGPESAYVREMAKWNKPYQYVPYPRMLYKARKVEGRWLCVDPRPDREPFTTSNQKTVHSEEEYQRALSERVQPGETPWCDSPTEAVEKGHDIERGISTAEAERFAAEARMSEKAQREAKARDEALSDGEHVPELPEEPLQKRALQCASKTKAGKRCSFKPVDGGEFCKKHSH